MAEPSLVSQNPIVNVPSPTKGFTTFGAQQGVQNVAAQGVASTNLAAETAAKEQSAGQLASELATLQLKQQQLQMLRNKVIEETGNIQRLSGERSSLQGQVSAAQQQLQAAQSRLAQIQAENDRRKQIVAPTAQSQPQAVAPNAGGLNDERIQSAFREAQRILDTEGPDKYTGMYMNEFSASAMPYVAGGQLTRYVASKLLGVPVDAIPPSAAYTYKQWQG
jgi:hypothetical protein